MAMVRNNALVTRIWATVVWVVVGFFVINLIL